MFRKITNSWNNILDKIFGKPCFICGRKTREVNPFDHRQDKTPCHNICWEEEVYSYNWTPYSDDIDDIREERKVEECYWD